MSLAFERHAENILRSAQGDYEIFRMRLHFGFQYAAWKRFGAAEFMPELLAIKSSAEQAIAACGKDIEAQK